MTKSDLGAYIILGAALFGIFIWMHFRISKLETKNAQLQQGVTDANIKDGVHKLTEPELDALLAKDLKPGAPKT